MSLAASGAFVGLRSSLTGVDGTACGDDLVNVKSHRSMIWLGPASPAFPLALVPTVLRGSPSAKSTGRSAGRLAADGALPCLLDGLVREMRLSCNSSCSSSRSQTRWS